jgi:hypothetical protein
MTAGHPAKGLAHKGCALALEAIHLPPQTLLLCNVPRRPSAPIDVTGIELMSAARTTEAGVVRIEAPCTRTRKEGQELHRKVPTHNQRRDEHCQPEGLCMYMCAWVCTPVCVPLRIHCTCAYILASMCVQAAEFSCTDLYQGHKSLMPTRRGQFHPSGAPVCVAWINKPLADPVERKGHAHGWWGCRSGCGLKTAAVETPFRNKGHTLSLQANTGQAVAPQRMWLSRANRGGATQLQTPVSLSEMQPSAQDAPFQAHVD